MALDGSGIVVVITFLRLPGFGCFWKLGFIWLQHMKCYSRASSASERPHMFSSQTANYV